MPGTWFSRGQIVQCGRFVATLYGHLADGAPPRSDCSRSGAGFLFLVLWNIVWIKSFACAFQLFKITAYPNKKIIFLIDHAIICFRRMGVNICFVAIYDGNLPPQQFSVFSIRFIVDIKRDDCWIVNRYHVVKAQQAEFPIVKFHYVMPGLYICVVRLWRFHRDEVSKTPNIENNAYIGPSAIFVILYSDIYAF